jgi:hypothetical protein
MTRFLFVSDSCEFVDVGRSLWREDGSVLLQLLLTLASAVILGFESLGTHNHILLSQIRDFPFRRLLRLAGLRWRYSTPPPHGSRRVSESKLCYDQRFSRPVCLGIKQPPGVYDQIFITVRQLQASCCGALSLTRGRVCLLPDSAVIRLLSLCTIYMLQVIKCMYIQHMQGLCQSRLNTADHALSLVGPAANSQSGQA